MPVELVKEIKFKAGYIVRTEKYSGTENGVPEGESFERKSAYTPEGLYIGTPKDARQLIVKRGIKPEYRTANSSVCSIGFCEADQKWYGWSHRAFCGFGIGHLIFEEDFGGEDENVLFVAHGSKPILTLDDARQAACNFANYVS